MRRVVAMLDARGRSVAAFECVSYRSRNVATTAVHARATTHELSLPVEALGAPPASDPAAWEGDYQDLILVILHTRRRSRGVPVGMSTRR
jgi:hypothetical protein